MVTVYVVVYCMFREAGSVVSGYIVVYSKCQSDTSYKSAFESYFRICMAWMGDLKLGVFYVVPRSMVEISKQVISRPTTFGPNACGRSTS